MSYTINNFFNDVNKNWLTHHKIPANNTSMSYFDIIENDIHGDLIKIIHKERRSNTLFGEFIESFYTGHTNDMNILELFSRCWCFIYT